VEGVRQDVRVVNLSLVNMAWYIRELKHQEPFGARKIALSLTDAQINQIQPRRWQPRAITLPVPKDVIREFGVTDTAVIHRGAVSFTMPATLHFGDVQAIRVQDIVVKDIVEQNTWKRPIYFAMTCSEDTKIGIDDYLRLDGFAYRVVPMKRSPDPNVEPIDEPVLRKDLLEENPGFSRTYQPGFKFRGLNDSGMFLDENEIRYVQNYRYLFARLASYYLTVAQNKDLAVRTLDQMQRVIPPRVVEMDYRLLYSIANLYFTAGAVPQYRALADTLEKIALKRVDENPSDVSGYFNPYRILADLYEKNGEYLKAQSIFERLAALDPGSPQIQKEIERFRELGRKQDSTASSGGKK